MTPTPAVDETPEPTPARPPGPLTDQSVALRALAAVTRALAMLPPDAQDGALVEALGAALIPEFADFCLFHAADSTGQLHLMGVAPSESAQAQQLAAHLDEQGALMIVYEPLVDDERPVFISAASVARDDDDDATDHLALVQAAGLLWELVVPLHAGEMTDALLVLDRLDGQGDQASLGLEQTAALHVAAVLAGLVSGWRAGRAQRRGVETLRSQLEEAASAGRELAHTLNNSLTMPVGVVELLLDRSTLSTELQEMVEAAAADLAVLERHIRGFQDQMRTYSGGRPSDGSALPPP